MSNEASSTQVKYYLPDDKPYGRSFGEWTVKWWQWAVTSPVETNPVLDHNGKYAHVGQNGPVWFLAGTFAENIMPTRKCIVPHGKAILFPIINYEINSDEEPTLRTDDEMVEHVVNDIDDIVKRIVIVNSINIPSYRVQSIPKVFDLTISENNPLGIAPGVKRVAADGYWSFLHPLPDGQHEIYFHGSCNGGIRISNAKYLITVSK